MTIRYITEADIPKLENLDKKCFSPVVRYNRFQLAYYVSMPYSVGLGDFVDDRLLGFIITAMAAENTMNIVTIDVDPEVRKRGIGKRLLKSAIEILKRLNITKITLQVAIDNEVATNFYLNQGFKITKKLPKYYPTTDGYQMEFVME